MLLICLKKKLHFCGVLSQWLASWLVVSPVHFSCVTSNPQNCSASMHSSTSCCSLLRLQLKVTQQCMQSWQYRSSCQLCSPPSSHLASKNLAKKQNLHHHFS